MYEYHGWASISESPVEDDDGRLIVLTNSVRSKLAKITNGVHDLQTINGMPLLSLAGFSNRPGTNREQVHEFFHHVARTAAWSYGLLYERDDELPEPNNNRFRVWRLARGVFLEMRDELLSPCIPIIELPE